MKPVDPRLLARSRPARNWIVVSGVLTALGSTATIGMGVFLARITAAVIAAPAPLDQLWQRHSAEVAVMVFCSVIRLSVAWALQRFGTLAAAWVIADLRSQALSTLAYSDPRTVDAPMWRAITTTGIDGLGPYISGFLPSLVAMCLSTPIALAAVGWLDVGSLIIAVITLPLIPVFMWLVGLLTQGKTEQRLRDVATLHDQILDLVVGLPTLRAYGVASGPTSEVKRLSDAHHTSSMAVLRIAFLSGMVLEFFATISVALVAVGIGFRLLDGSMTLSAGLAVLVIIPEVYAPVRDVGKRFHDAQDGLIASSAVLDLLLADATSPAPTALSTSTAEVATSVSVAKATGIAGIHVVMRNFSACGRDGARPHNVSVHAKPGQITVLAGDNGSGKSTALLGIVGIATAGIRGTATVIDVQPAETSAQSKVAESLPAECLAAECLTAEPRAAEQLWPLCAYISQRPVLDDEVVDSSVGDTSALSLGQRQRVAFAQQLSDTAKRLILVDEPTAHLDETNARNMISTLRERANNGATIVVASHDPLVLAAADSVITLCHTDAQADTQC